MSLMFSDMEITGKAGVETSLMLPVSQKPCDAFD